MGVCLNAGIDSDSKKVLMSDSEIYGEVGDVNDDCPNPLDHQNCFCLNKMGLMLFSFGSGIKPLHPNWPNELPIYEPIGNALWVGEVELDNVNFNKFSGKTKCGMKQRAIERNQP